MFARILTEGCCYEVKRPRWAAWLGAVLGRAPELEPGLDQHDQKNHQEDEERHLSQGQRAALPHRNTPLSECEQTWGLAAAA